MYTYANHTLLTRANKPTGFSFPCPSFFFIPSLYKNIQYNKYTYIAAVTLLLATKVQVRSHSRSTELGLNLVQG